MSHSGEGQNPVTLYIHWTPAFARVTKSTYSEVPKATSGTYVKNKFLLAPIILSFYTDPNQFLTPINSINY